MDIGYTVRVVCVRKDVEAEAVLEDGPYFRCGHCQCQCLKSDDHYTVDDLVSPDYLIATWA